MERYREIEKSIIKKYRKEIWSKFVKAIKEYQLIQEGDKIAVCISGGKDSMLLAKCMQQLYRHGQFHFEVEYLVMDPGYTEEHRKEIEENAKMLNIPIRIFETNIFDSVFHITEGSPCYLCARMRRGHLYSYAQSLGCNKIALGHHYDDVLETILLSLFYSGEFKTMMPKLHSQNFKGMELIRPLYLVHEKDIIHWASYNDLIFLNCACRFTLETDLDKEGKSKRKEMKELIQKFRKINPYIEKNIFHSVENVNLGAIIGYTENGEKHHFLDSYEEK